MTMPIVPKAHLTFVQAGLALGLFDTLLGYGAGRDYLRQFYRRCVDQRIGLVGDIGQVTERTAGQQPGIPLRQPVAAFDHALANAVAGDQALPAFGKGQTLPAALAPTRDDFLDGRRHSGRDDQYHRGPEHGILRDYWALVLALTVGPTQGIPEAAVAAIISVAVIGAWKQIETGRGKAKM